MCLYPKPIRVRYLLHLGKTSKGRGQQLGTQLKLFSVCFHRPSEQTPSIFFRHHVTLERPLVVPFSVPSFVCSFSHDRCSGPLPAWFAAGHTLPSLSARLARDARDAVNERGLVGVETSNMLRNMTSLMVTLLRLTKG